MWCLVWLSSVITLVVSCATWWLSLTGNLELLLFVTVCLCTNYKHFCVFCLIHPGVLINSGSKPTLRGNRIYSCGTFGLEVINEAGIVTSTQDLMLERVLSVYLLYNACVGGIIENNTVFDNQYDGIALATGVHPQLRGSTIHGSESDVWDTSLVVIL